MVVFVLNKNDRPLMPCKPQKARKLLKEGRATVVRRTPFTIKLNYPCRGYVQENTLKMDTGSKTIGVSVVCDMTRTELFSGEAIVRNDIVKLIATRRELRRTRRNKKTRYRKPRFMNRKASKQKGWLAPSVRNKIQEHIHVIKFLHKILPISHIITEVAEFDIQKIKNPEIYGIDYQNGEQKDFWNTRQYVLYRDGYTCQCCKGKSKDKILNVHHIESRNTGGNAPNNLITLCDTCHKGYHNGTVTLPKKIKRGMKFKDATYMNIMRWSFYNELVSIYGDKVSLTYGYETKSHRIANSLPKLHRVDALCIEEPEAKNIIRSDVYYLMKKVRCHNRQIHKQQILKGGKKKLNQQPYNLLGFHLFDRVLYKGNICFITGRRSSGYFKLSTLDGNILHTSAKYQDLHLLEPSKSHLIEMKANVYK